MKKGKLSTTYEALGFVEALIAIMVSGIVATVLINISVVAMRELVRLDIEDAQAHQARSAAVIVQNIANRERLKEDSEYFSPTRLQKDRCYILRKLEGGYEIDNTQSYQIGERDTYRFDAVIDDGVNDNEEDYFRIICIASNQPSGTKKMLIKVVVGFNKVEGMFGTTSDIRDYQYFAIINL